MNVTETAHPPEHNESRTAVLLIDCAQLSVSANARAAGLFGPTGARSPSAPEAGVPAAADRTMASMPLEQVLGRLPDDEQTWLRNLISECAHVGAHGPQRRLLHVRDDQGAYHEVDMQLELPGASAAGLLLAILHEPAEDDLAFTSADHSSLSVLAGGIAHDFNNLLVGVMGNLDLARYSQNISADTQHHLDAALQAAERAAELCRQLLAYSGRTPVRTVIKDINQELRRVTPLLRRVVEQDRSRIRPRRMAPDIALSIEPAAGALLAPIDSGLVVQLLLNLVSNAADACAPGGSIRVRTQAVQWPPAASDSHPQTLHWVQHVPAPGAYVQIEVIDDGAGISESLQARIFEPMFSSHGEGRGLGLPATEGIVRQHGGSIALRSRVGQGTSITVMLPAAHPSAPAQAHVVRGPRSGTLLIVDDEPTVRDVLRLHIERLGYRSAAVGNGQLAIDYVQKHGDAVCAVVLDQTMPVMGGAEAYRRLREIAPQIPIIMTTGYGEENLLELIAHDRHAAFLAKPYALGRLRELLEQLTA